MTDATREALIKLRAEVAGIIGYGYNGLVSVLGVTNVRVLQQRVAEADAALSPPVEAPTDLGAAIEALPVTDLDGDDLVDLHDVLAVVRGSSREADIEARERAAYEAGFHDGVASVDRYGEQHGLWEDAYAAHLARRPASPNGGEQ